MIRTILLVRLSAFGDIIHLFPAISDIRRRHPEARIDLAVDERFAGLAGLHPGVDRVIALPLKRLQRSGAGAAAWRELTARLRELRRLRYDRVLDMHGVWKSAVVARCARAARRVGLVSAECGEKPAAWFYHERWRTGAVAAVERMRLLAARSLDTDAARPVDYGLRRSPAAVSDRRVVFAHSSSKPEKLWPETHWIALGRALAGRGLRICLPWGDAAERERSERLRAAIGAAVCEVPPRYPIETWASRLAGCPLLIGVDTGLTHLAAAAATPCLALFTATSPALFVPARPSTARALAAHAAELEPERVLREAERLLAAAPVMSETPLPEPEAALEPARIRVMPGAEWIAAPALRTGVLAEAGSPPVI